MPQPLSHSARDKGSALEGFSALYDGTGNADLTILESITTRCTLEYELVELCQRHGGRVSRGKPIGLLPELWPHDLMKRALIEHAEEFARQIKGQGFEPQSGVYAFKLWGPYTEKVGQPREWVPEEGNPLISQPRKAQQVFGYRGNEFDWNKGATFLIQGNFTRAAKHGHVSEENGVIWV